MEPPSGGEVGEPLLEGLAGESEDFDNSDDCERRRPRKASGLGRSADPRPPGKREAPWFVGLGEVVGVIHP